MPTCRIHRVQTRNPTFSTAAAMRIQDYDSVCDVTKPADIAAALSKRHGNGINSFWLLMEPTVSRHQHSG